MSSGQYRFLWPAGTTKTTTEEADGTTTTSKRELELIHDDCPAVSAASCGTKRATTTKGPEVSALLPVSARQRSSGRRRSAAVSIILERTKNIHATNYSSSKSQVDNQSRVAAEWPPGTRRSVCSSGRRHDSVARPAR